MRGILVARVLRRIADAVEKLDESEIDRFLSNLGRKEPWAEIGKSKNSMLPKNRHAKVDPVALEEVLGQLEALPTRAEGRQLLEKLDLGRKQLEALVKLRDVFVTKNDNVDRIKEKLIEATIGARLSSRAIRGLAEEP